MEAGAIKEIQKGTNCKILNLSMLYNKKLTGETLQKN